MFVIYALRGLAVSLKEVEVVTYGITNPHASMHIPCITRHRYGQVVLAEYGRRGEITQRRTVTHACQHSARLCLALYASVQRGILCTYIHKERAVEEGKHLLYDEVEAIYPPVYGDRNRLRQVFLNILDNALKYTPKGGVVAAQVLYSKDEPDIIKIVVTDSGCGIPAEDLPKVKEKFYKANQTVGGSGIGLAVADEIMNLHNGKLDIESGEGVGTTVTLTFPVYKEGEENDTPETVKL